MNRTYLEGAAEALATIAGYQFYVGPEAQMVSTIKSYPAVWLSPLELQAIEGRRHGQATYTINLYLLKSGAALSPKRCQNELSIMELDAIELFTSLSLDQRILSIEALNIKPLKQAMTPHGDIAMSATARILTRF